MSGGVDRSLRGGHPAGRDDETDHHQDDRREQHQLKWSIAVAGGGSPPGEPPPATPAVHDLSAIGAPPGTLTTSGRASCPEPRATNFSTGAVTTSLTWIVHPGTNEVICPVTVILTVLAELPAVLADTSFIQPSADDWANWTAAAAPSPGGGCAVLATSAPCRAAASTVSLARYQIDAWTIVMIPIRKTGTTIT